MKTVSNYILRGVAAIVFGAVLIIWPQQASIYLVIAIGLFFMLPGLYSLFVCLLSNKEKREALSFPIEASGSAVLGLLLLAFPSFFISILMYLLGILAIIGGGSLILHLLTGRKQVVVPLWYYVLPVLIVAAGILILAKPERVVEKTFMLFGAVSVLFGLSLLINGFTFRKNARR